MSSSYTLDVGTVIALNVGTSTVGCTGASIYVKLPDGTITNWSAVPDGNTSITHTVTADIYSSEIAQAGVYTLQAVVSFGSSIFYGQSVTYRVRAAFT